jgi:hypothetical protein
MGSFILGSRQMRTRHGSFWSSRLRSSGSPAVSLAVLVTCWGCMSAPTRLEVNPAARASSEPPVANDANPATAPDAPVDLAAPGSVDSTSANSDSANSASANSAAMTPVVDVDATAGAGGASSESNPEPVGVAGSESDTATASCWQLPVITRARILAAPGSEAALVGGKIMGSTTSAMNGFVDLAVIAAAPAPGEWVELPIDTTTAYRYVKYYGPENSYAVVAEVQFFAGNEQLSGAGFGTAAVSNAAAATGSTPAADPESSAAPADAHPFSSAFDGDPATYYQSSLPSNSYVGLDVGAAHVEAAPAISPAGGSFDPAPTVTLTAAAGATVLYTLDGSDPATAGTPYTAPFTVPAGSTLLRAVAERDCALPSVVAKAVFQVPEGAPPPVTTAADLPPLPTIVRSSMHIGNSLTDTIVDIMEPLAASGGVLLDFNRYTIPGAGTWMYDTNPTGGFGVANVQTSLRTRPFDDLSMQPYPNEPCQIVPSTGGPDSGPDSDSGYVMEAWTDALSQNPNVQLWIYQQWPEPVKFTNCITGGGWLRSDDWQPPTPTNWEEAVMNELAYQEKLVGVLMTLNPAAPRPYIVPGGLGLVNLKHAIEAGTVPGFTQFFPQIFLSQGTDVHLTPPGAYFISLLFYSTMFQRNPGYTANDPSYQLTDEQMRVFQSIAWDTVMNYASSGLTR